jgi:AcrR family transcriptional regulator
MARRSDHSRSELRDIIVEEGLSVMGQSGFAAFSAREVARRIGYSVGTIYNVFDSLDHLVVAINTRTFVLWAQFVRDRLSRAKGDRIAVLVRSYFDFARDNRNLWMAIYDHRLPPGMEMPVDDEEVRSQLTLVVIGELARLLPGRRESDLERMARSLVATVHGHCTFALNGSFDLMGEKDPVGLALTRVRESIAANHN